MAINKIEIQNSTGDIYYPHTSSDIVKHNNSTLSAFLDLLENKFKTYLPVAGGTITGPIKPNANGTIDFGDSSKRFRHMHMTGTFSQNNGVCEALMYLFSDMKGLKFALNDANGTNINELFFCVRNNASYLEPKYDGVPVNGSYLNSIGLGRTGRRFRDVWSVNGTVQTSDINCKENIEEIVQSKSSLKTRNVSMLTKEDIYDTVKKLTPISFDYKGYGNFDVKDGESFRQIGISAQQLEELNADLFERVGVKSIVEEKGVENEEYGIKTFAYTNMLLVALQETINKVEKLEKEIEKIKQA